MVQIRHSRLILIATHPPLSKPLLVDGAQPDETLDPLLDADKSTISDRRKKRRWGQKGKRRLHIDPAPSHRIMFYTVMDRIVYKYMSRGITPAPVKHQQNVVQ